MARNASVCQVYPVSRITGEGRAELRKQEQKLGARGEKEGEAGGGGAGAGATQSVRENYRPVYGDQ